jgi:phosphate-selective porin OprO and OprP
VKVLQRNHELDAEAAAARAKEAPKLTVGSSGFTLSSAEGDFALQLKGALQVDSRTFFADGGIKGNDGFILRRARPILQGTVFRDFDFLFLPDFGGSTVQIVDAYLNYRLRPELQLQAGKFKSPVGLEQLQADVNTTFNERALATDLVPYRDVGVDVHGDLFGGTIGYAVGIFNGTPDYTTTTSNSDYDDNKALAARLFFQPFKKSAVAALQGLGFGVGGSYEVDRAWTNTSSTGLTPGFTTDGQQKFFTYTNGVVGNGTHWRISPQTYYYYGPFSLLGEYTISDQQVQNVTKGRSADLQHTGWEVTAGWVLTGEDATYNNGVTPRHPFDPLGGRWGALQLIGRYAELDVDKAAFPIFADPGTSASEAQAWAVGLNWYLNRSVVVKTSFSRTTFDGGNGTKATVTKQPENVLFTRMQLSF